LSSKNTLVCWADGMNDHGTRPEPACGAESVRPSSLVIRRRRLRARTYERALIAQAARTVDLLDELDDVVRREGAMVTSPQGLIAHPAAKEARAQGITLARLLAALRLPSGEERDRQASARARRPQRRSGARGTYGIRGMAR
jgi:hypothetical protein